MEQTQTKTKTMLSCIKCAIEFASTASTVEELAGCSCPLCGNLLAVLKAKVKEHRFLECATGPKPRVLRLPRNRKPFGVKR